MAAPIPIYEQRETFYVPHFQVKVEGRDLPDNVVGDVIDVSYHDNVRDIDRFELTVNNWDAQAFSLKYEPPVKGAYRGIFDPGRRLELWLGYIGDLRLMLKGEITSLQPSFPASGAPTLKVGGLNVLHKLRARQHTHSWKDKRDSEIAESLGRQPGAGEQPGLEVPVRTDAGAKASEPTEPHVFMHNQYDIVFLMERARRRGYTVYLDVDPESGDEFLWFGPSDRLRDVTYRLEWGKSLISFTPRLSTTSQVRRVTVRGVNRRTHETIVKTATWGQSGVTINDDQREVAQAISSREEIVTDEPVDTPEQADARARDLLLAQLKEMITGNGATVGLPDLRAGRRLRISGLGPRFSGEYFVTETTHTIGGNGYTTSFGARREKGE